MGDTLQTNSCRVVVGDSSLMAFGHSAAPLWYICGKPCERLWTAPGTFRICARCWPGTAVPWSSPSCSRWWTGRSLSAVWISAKTQVQLARSRFPALPQCWPKSCISVPNLVSRAVRLAIYVSHTFPFYTEASWPKTPPTNGNCLNF